MHVQYVKLHQFDADIHPEYVAAAMTIYQI